MIKQLRLIENHVKHSIKYLLHPGIRYFHKQKHDIASSNEQQQLFIYKVKNYLQLC